MDMEDENQILFICKSIGMFVTKLHLVHAFCINKCIVLNKQYVMYFVETFKYWVDSPFFKGLFR